MRNDVLVDDRCIFFCRPVVIMNYWWKKTGLRCRCAEMHGRKVRASEMGKFMGSIGLRFTSIGVKITRIVKISRRECANIWDRRPLDRSIFQITERLGAEFAEKRKSEKKLLICLADSRKFSNHFGEYVWRWDESLKRFYVTLSVFMIRSVGGCRTQSILKKKNKLSRIRRNLRKIFENFFKF